MRGAGRRFRVAAALTVVLAAACGDEPKPDIPGLVSQLKSPDPAVSGKATTDLVTVGEPAVPAIAALLADPEPRVRKAAASTLWGMGPKAAGAVDQLRAVIRDPVPE